MNSGKGYGTVSLSNLAQKDGNFRSPGTPLWGILHDVEAEISKNIAQIGLLVDKVDSASGTPSAISALSSVLKNAGTTSSTPAMGMIKRPML
jgi:hypothetical protein